ncbi:MAG: putative nucleotidyltransferase substrate binding domain-containing protein [Candidatus Competibacterales bacterium]
MPSSEQRSFIAAVHPFDGLPSGLLAEASKAMDIGYFRADEVLIAPDRPARHLFIVIKGTVREQLEGETVAVYGHQDAFDALALLEGQRDHHFIASEELLCHLLPAEVFCQLCSQNAAFRSFFYQNLTARLNQMIERRARKDLSSFTAAKVRDAYYRPPLLVDFDTSIVDAVAAMDQAKVNSLLVQRKTPQGETEWGMVSDTDLRRRVILARRSTDDPIGEIASFGVIGVDKRDFLFNAQVTMNRHNVKRLAVFDGDTLDGVLDQIDLFSFFSNHSRLIAVQVERATNLTELAKANDNFLAMVRALYDKGVKMRYLAELVTDLNQKLFHKLYGFIAPPDLVANSCFVVMGSEGRGEQILKTDQDNALILRDGFVCPDLEAITQRLIDTMVAFGYPLCPGEVMVNNPNWCRSFQGYKRTIEAWVEEGGEDDLMNLAIFFDARAVAGDVGLLSAAKGWLFNLLEDHPAFYARFARPTLAFDTPLGLFENFVVERRAARRHQLDIKKGGIFPIVHGVRSLALEYRDKTTNTLERIKGLHRRGLFAKRFSIDLTEAFAFMCWLRLQSELRQLDERGSYDNYITPKDLSKIERDALRDSLKIVNDFKKLVAHHFRLNLLT